MTADSLIAVARRLSFVRETLGPNRGLWVSKLQRTCGGQPGDSWCADFVSFVEDVVYEGHPPTLCTGSAQQKFLDCVKQGYVVQAPQPGDLYFFLTPQRVAHHVGIVTDVSPLTGIAGNTSPDGTSSNGTGVFEHVIPLVGTVFARLP